MNLSGRPCNNCSEVNHCEDLECKEFNAWCDEAEEIERPQGFTTREVLALYPQLTKKKLSNIQRSGKVDFVIYKYRAIYKNLKQIEDIIYAKPPQGKLTTEEVMEVTGKSIHQIKWYLKEGKLMPPEKWRGRNYFSEMEVTIICEL